MCGRYTVSDPNGIAARFGIEVFHETKLPHPPCLTPDAGGQLEARSVSTLVSSVRNGGPQELRAAAQ